MLDRASAALGEASLTVVSAANALGVTYKYASDFAAAESAYRRAAAAAAGLTDQDPLLEAGLLHNLGGLAHSRGDAASGIPLAERGLALRAEALGPGHPDVARDLNALGALYHLAGRSADAERSYRQALAVFEESYGPGHFEVAMTAANLAVLQGDQGDFAQAESLGRRSLEILTAVLGPRDAEVGLTLLNLAAAVAGQGREAEAAELADQAAAILADRLPPATRTWWPPTRQCNATGVRHERSGHPRRHGVPALIPALPRAAWVVLGGDFVSAVGSGLTLPCLFVYAHQVRHLGYGTAGLVVASIALASLAGNPLGGALADRWTPRRAVHGRPGSRRRGLGRAGPRQVRRHAVRGELPVRPRGIGDLASPGCSAGQRGRPGGPLGGLLGSPCLVQCRARPRRPGRGSRGQRHPPGNLHRGLPRRRRSFLAFVPVLARLRLPERGEPSSLPAAGPQPGSFRQVLRDKAFLRVWALTAFIVTVSFGQFQSSFPGYATGPGGIGTQASAWPSPPTC